MKEAVVRSIGVVVILAVIALAVAAVLHEFF